MDFTHSQPLYKHVFWIGNSPAGRKLGPCSGDALGWRRPGRGQCPASLQAPPAEPSSERVPLTLPNPLVFAMPPGPGSLHFSLMGVGLFVQFFPSSTELGQGVQRLCQGLVTNYEYTRGSQNRFEVPRAPGPPVCLLGLCPGAQQQKTKDLLVLFLIATTSSDESLVSMNMTFASLPEKQM